MNKLQFYKYGMWLLLLINIGIVAFFFFRPRPPRNPESHAFMDRAAELLQLDPNQKEAFGALAKEHKEQMVMLERQIKDAVVPYFLSITKQDGINRDSTERVMIELERQKIVETYAHFDDVRKILNPNQEKYFDRFISQALNIIMEETEPEMPVDSK